MNSIEREPVRTRLELGDLPVEELAMLAIREGRRPRAVYQTHKWFARRFGSVFRALLTAAALPSKADFWEAYYNGVDWRGKTILDPFVGGGTSVVEAQRLGATVIGVDVDPVACAITRFETRLAQNQSLQTGLEHLKRLVGDKLEVYYQTLGPNNEVQNVLHYFWVQVVACHQCGQLVEAHPHYQLAYEAEGTKQWAFCAHCHKIQVLDRTTNHLSCTYCNSITTIKEGTVNYGRLTCPYCQNQERLIDVAQRTEHPPTWRLFALEVLEVRSSKKNIPLKQRSFRVAGPYDLERFDSAKVALNARRLSNGSLAWVPSKQIPTQDRSDDRLIRYGYTKYEELFNDRQLLHLSHLAEAISSLPMEEREAYAIAFSDHLTTNCMMTHYAFGWRRLAPLFSVRAFRHVSRPVEINPWIAATGRGTFPNSIRQVQAAINWAQAPKEPLLEGGFRQVANIVTDNESAHNLATIYNQKAQAMNNIADSSVDIVLTDPPYFDNIAYSELSDFFVPWLQQFGLVSLDSQTRTVLSNNLSALSRSEPSLATFEQGLSSCFAEISRVLKPDGRLIFTYQHVTPQAWYALAVALARSDLKPIQIFPLLGDGISGIHKHDGNSHWDAVFVVAHNALDQITVPLRVSPRQKKLAEEHFKFWIDRLSNMPEELFRKADKANFYRACITAGALGMFGVSTESDFSVQPLRAILSNIPVEN